MSTGDGWTHCRRGHRHWGRYGAAGLLLFDGSSVLLQLRSRHTHHGGTWSIPGGACDLHETTEQAAVREAGEEIGLQRADVRILGSTVDDHGNWSYTTVLGAPLRTFQLTHNRESDAARWVPLADVTDLPLHSGFLGSWSTVLAMLRHA